MFAVGLTDLKLLLESIREILDHKPAARVFTNKLLALSPISDDLRETSLACIPNPGTALF